MNILVVSGRNIYPIDAGFKKRIYHVSTALSEIGNVDLLVLDRVSSISENHPFNDIISFPISKQERALSIAKWTLQGLPIQVGYFWNSKAYNWLVENQKKYDLIWLNHIRLLPYSHGIIRPIVFDLHDSIALHYLQSLKSVSSPIWKRIYQFEYPRLQHAEVYASKHFPTIVVSPVDSKFIEYSGGNKPYVIPMGINPLAFQTPFYTQRENIITFIGKLDYLPNKEGITWFIKNVHPKLPEKLKDYKLVVIGGHAPEELLRLAEQFDNVQLTGFVENPYEIMAKAKFNIAPIFIGAGIQNKLLEGFAVGTPTITTIMGKRPIHRKLKKHLLVANSPEEWVETIVNIWNNKDFILSTGKITKHLSQEIYSWSNIYKQIQKLALKITIP